MKKNIIIIGSIVLGIVFVALAVLYFKTPANMLPSYIPGFDVSVTKIHLKHGIGSLLLGLASFVYAWFASGKKSANQ